MVAEVQRNAIKQIIEQELEVFRPFEVCTKLHQITEAEVTACDMKVKIKAPLRASCL